MEAGNYSSLGFFSGSKTSLPAWLSRCWPHTSSLVRSFPFATIDGLLQVPWLLSINGAAHGQAGAPLNPFAKLLVRICLAMSKLDLCLTGITTSFYVSEVLGRAYILLSEFNI